MQLLVHRSIMIATMNKNYLIFVLMPEQKEEQKPSVLVLIFLFISSPIVAFLLYKAFHSF